MKFVYFGWSLIRDRLSSNGTQVARKAGFVPYRRLCAESSSNDYQMTDQRYYKQIEGKIIISHNLSLYLSAIILNVFNIFT